jgi:L-alanine-DL-glutamate epimerase-like enolase superfamily enzyme
MRVKTVRQKRLRKVLKIPFVTSRGERRNVDNVILEIEMADGRLILSEVPSATTIEEMGRKEVLNKAKTELRGLPVCLWEEFVKDMRRRHPEFPLTVSALEIGLFKAMLCSKGTDPFEFFGSAISRIETDITVPFSSWQNLERWLEAASRDGFSTFKLKLKGDLEADLEFLSLAYRLLQTKVHGLKLRLDFNRAYDVRTFEKFLAAIEKEPYPIELLEEPTSEALTCRLASALPWPIFLDESIMGRGDLMRALEGRLLSGVNIKLARTGIIESLAMVEIAKGAGLKLMIGCMMESLIGLSTSVYLACGKGIFQFVDLDSIYFLHSKKEYERIRVEGPFYEVT